MRKVVSPSFQSNNFTVKVKKKKFPRPSVSDSRGTMASKAARHCCEHYEQGGQEGYGGGIGRDCDWLTSKL